jgi:multidrug resistance efflux pump
MALAAADSAEARAKEAEVYVQRLASSKGLTVSEAQLDHAQRDAKVAAAQFAEARAKLALLQAGSRREDVQEAQSTRDAARAWLAEAAARLDYCSVRAPSVGVILDTHVTRGQLVSAAAPMVLLTLVDDSRRRVRAEVHERDVAGVCPKQHAVVTSEAFPGTQLEAATEWISEGMRQPAMSTANEQKGDVREVLLSLGAGGINWPIGLRVSVKFGNCPETQ